MAQISGSRSEFMTSDLGISDIEYKRKGGCFLSHKKTVAIIIVFIVGVITAGVIGAYVSPWTKNRSIAELTLAEEDEVNGFGTPAKFAISPLILPTFYTIELTPVTEKTTVTKLKGHVVVHFTYNGTQSLSQLVFNAKDINVSEKKLFSLDDSMRKNVHSRKRRDNDAAEGNSNSHLNNSSDTSTVAITPEIVANDIGSLANSSSDDVSNVTSMDIGNVTASNSSNETITTYAVSSSTSTTAAITTIENKSYSEKGDGVSAASSEQPDVVQKISPPVSSRPMFPDTPVQSIEIAITRDEMDTADGFYVIYPDTPIRRGEYSVEITYEAQINGQSMFANVYDLEGQRRWLLATKLKPLGASTLFPSFDDPSSKARFSLSVARPETLIALANMPLQSSDPVSDGWVMDHFEKSPPLSSHNLAFLIGDLQPIRETTMEDTKVPLTLWARSSNINETHFIVDKMGKVTQSLNEFFSTSYSMPKLDVVALPGLLVDGMGSTGLISIREPLFYLREESSAITKELAIKNVIKLIGEQWLGGLVSAQTRSDSWFLEGSLIYLQHLLAEKIDPAVDSSTSFGVIQHTALEADSYGISKSLKSKFIPVSLETTFFQNTYKKGACVIRMLHNVISDSGFRNGYKKFLSRWMNASAGVSDFWNAMSDEAHWLPDGASLAQAMTPWVAQSGFPVVTVTRNYETASAVIRQEQFAHDNSTLSNRQFWYIPLTYVGDGDDWSSPMKSWLKQEERVTLEDVGKREEKKWVLFNVNQTGYYRVNYDAENWSLLSSALNSTFEKFPVTTRTLLVDDALSLAWSGRLGYPTALNLIRYLDEKETHYSPWTVAFQNMMKLNNLLHNTAAYSSFQGFMVKFISTLLKKVTTTSEESQIKLMAIKWACLVDNPECRSYLKSLPSVPEYLEETHQCTLAKFGGRSEWDSLLSNALKATDRGAKLRLLAALPCFQVEWILETLLNDILKGEKFDGPETLVLLQSLSENPMAARSTFQFVRRRWNDIFERFSKSYLISKAFLIAAMSGITNDQDLKDFQIFKEDYYVKLKSMGHTIAVAEAEARSRSSWLKTNLVPVQAWLDDYTRPTS